MPYVLAPYERVPDAPRPVRRCSLARILPPQAAGEMEPFIEAEGLGGYAVALILDPKHAATAAAAPGVLALPDAPLTGKLGDSADAALRRELRDAIVAQGFTPRQVRVVLGSDFAKASLLSTLRFMCSARRKPRIDANGEIALDGPAQPTRPLPLPLIAGGAFGDALAVVDNYNRTDASTLGANWSAEPLNDGVAMPHIVSNTAMSAGAFSNVGAWYNAATYGPDVEVAHTLPVAGSQYVYLYARLQEPSGSLSTADGYGMEIVNTAFKIYRYDNAVSTALGADQVVTFPANGNRIGFEANGTTLQAHRHTGSWATYGASRSDATYSGAGYVGWGSYEDTRTRTHDDFSVGTVTASTGTGGRLMLLGVG